MIQASACRFPASRDGFIDRHEHKYIQVLGHKGLQFDVYIYLNAFFLNSDVKQEACLKSCCKLRESFWYRLFGKAILRVGLTNRRQSVKSRGDGERVINSIVSYVFKDQLSTARLLA